MELLSTSKISFIGGGSMAEAIIRGLVGQNRAAPSSLFVLGRGRSERTTALGARYGVTPVLDAQAKRDVLAASDIVVLAVKPKDAVEALGEYGASLREGQLLVSVIAGLSIASIDKLIDRPLPIVRTMPNTSSSIGLGATGVSYNALASDAHKRLTRHIFESIGIVAEVPERQLDIVTGVSGSGPAYIYYIVESMIAGGVAGGLDEQTARQLTVQTVLGAAEMLRQTGEQPSELRRKVTSPNGTTEAAMELMRSRGVGDGVSGAVLRAAERAGEIGATIAGQIDHQRKEGNGR